MIFAGHDRAVFFTFVVVACLALWGCENKAEDPVTPAPPPDPPELGYAGSDACAECHVEEFHVWADSGHASVMTRVDGESSAAEFPAFAAFPNSVALPPSGYGWEDISYAVGGYAWKMLWLDEDGFLITGPDAQHNFGDNTRVAYEPDDPSGTRPFDCGRCHTTDWQDSDDGDPANNQDGLPGLVGKFFAAGVHCEACHGMGSFHAETPDEYSLVVDTSPEVCAPCHRHEPDDAIAVVDGFIQNGQQYSEWLASPHSGTRGPGCNDCHDAHASVKFQAAEATGITQTCNQCHPGFGALDGNNHPADASCVDCHMAKAVRSAISPEDNVGDVRSHIVQMSLSISKEDSMFTETGDYVRLDANSKAVITADFTCLVCHSSQKSTSRGLTWSEMWAVLVGDEWGGRVHRR